MTRTLADKQQLNSMLSYIQIYLEHNSKQGLFDENKVLEDIMCDVLNRIYGWNLKNLNYEKKNYPGIDLGDRALGIGVQVTAEKTSEKINRTISLVSNHKVYQEYPRLKILIMGKKQSSYSIQGNENVLFDVKEDIIDFSDLLDKSVSMKADDRHELVKFLQNELGWSSERIQNKAATYEKVKQYMEQQHQENSYITILGLLKKLPIENAWLKLNLMSEEDIQKKQIETQWEFLKQYDEYSGRGNSHTYDVETLLIEPGNKVVLAGPGMGKSTLCKKLFCQAEAMKKTVIKVRLWDVSGYMRGGDTFEEAVRKTMTQSLPFQFQREDLSNLFSILILDGLDECGDYRRTVAKSIAAWGFGHPGQKMIVTSRPIGYDAAELADFDHYQILPIDEFYMDSFARQLMEMVQPDYEDHYQWFSKKIKHRELYRLACRSPLVLGFMVQLSLKQKDFGTNKVSLYEAIMNEWLQGSSRENEKPVSEVELRYGIEAIAYYMMNCVNEASGDAYTKKRIIMYVGNCFAQEMGYTPLKAKKIAEQSLEFWLERGILDKGIHKEQECVLFLHLNIGEYLAACFLAGLSQNERKQWVHKHYRTNIWQETLRMAIACETDGCLVQELIAIEEKNQLPEGAVFLAAQGIGEGTKKHVPQSIYDKLLDYAFGNNKYLGERAAKVIDCLQGAAIDWHLDELEKHADADEVWEKFVAYHILFVAHWEDKEKLHNRARLFMLHYEEWSRQIDFRSRLGNLAKALEILIPNADDTKLTEAIKNISMEHTAASDVERIGEYLQSVGESKWFNARYEALMGGEKDFSLAMANEQIRQSEYKLIEILISLFGSTPTDKIEICREYSKIIAVIGYMESHIPDIRWLGFDLEREHSKELVRVITTVVELDQEQLKKELYSLMHFKEEESVFVSSNHLVHLHLQGDWSRCSGQVSVEALQEGLSGYSDILGDCAVYMAYYNLDSPDILSSLVDTFRKSPERRIVERVSRVLKARGYKDLSKYAEERLNDDSVPSFSCLFHCLSETPHYSNEQVMVWLSCIRQGLTGDRYLASAALRYIKKLDKNEMPKDLKSSLADMVKNAYLEWNRKEIRCAYCKEPVVINPDGFCPKCRFGAKLPTKDFIEVLTEFQCISMEEFMALCQHPMSEVVKVAERELIKIWTDSPRKLDSVINDFGKNGYDEHLFRLILRLPADLLYPYRDTLQKLGMQTNEKMLEIWIKKLRSLEWISTEELKEILSTCLHHESDEIRNSAMACWLN